MLWHARLAGQKNNDGGWETTIWLWKWLFNLVPRSPSLAARDLGTRLITVLSSQQYMHALRSHFGHSLCSFCYRRICLKQYLLVTNLTPSYIRKKISESKGHAPHRSWDFLLMATRVEALSGVHCSTSCLISAMLETSFAQVTFTTLVGCGVSKPLQNCLGHEPTRYFEA